jgi:Zn finger protein HypA/HybF involved in hydrogenase expression
MPIEEEFEEAENMRCVAEFVIGHGEVIENEPVYGIAKLVLDKGWFSLSPLQKKTFESIAVKRATRKCEWCDGIIPFDELVFDSNACGLCRYKMERIDRE